MQGSKLYRRLGLVAFVISVCLFFWLWDHRHNWLDHNVRVIEPGKILCGGYQYPGPLRRMLHNHQIKTVVCLRRPGTEQDALERQTVAESGTRFIRMAVPKGHSIAAKHAVVQDVVEFIADPANQPVYFHCWGGKHRVGAVLAVYRVEHCGWSQGRAIKELTRERGNNTGWTSAVLARHCKLRRSGVGIRPVENRFR